MAKYPNTLGLLVASELINDETTLSATPVIKATVHALKKYMKLRNDATGQRVLPIGYNAATSSARDRTVLDYLSSGGGESSIDFWTVSGVRNGQNEQKLTLFFFPSVKTIHGSESQARRTLDMMIWYVSAFTCTHPHYPCLC